MNPPIRSPGRENNDPIDGENLTKQIIIYVVNQTSQSSTLQQDDSWETIKNEFLKVFKGKTTTETEQIFLHHYYQSLCFHSLIG